MAKAPIEQHNPVRMEELTSVRPVDDSEERLFAEVDWLQQELARARAGHESGLQRLLAARVTLNSTVQFCGLCDAQGIAWESNETSVRAAGVRRSDVHGIPFWECRWWQGLPGEQEKLKAAIQRAARGELVRYDVENVADPEGRGRLIIDFNLNPVKDRHGKVVFMTAEGRDVTEQRRLEREVARQRDELARLDRLKTDFLANVSHELRTPLTLLLGPAEDALADTAEPLPPHQRERLELILRNGQRLQKLVNTLLDLSRLRAGHLEPGREPTDLSTLTAELTGLFRSAAERAGLALTVEAPALSQPVWVDRGMWEQVVFNLLSNALKFTFEGGITVRVREEPWHAVVQVEDTGSGIPAPELPHLFERFHRVKGARSRTHEGTGLGLALVRDLVRLHGGEVDVASEEGRGTTFTVRLPWGSAPPATEQRQAPSPRPPAVATAATFAEESLRGMPEPRARAEPSGMHAEAPAGQPRPAAAPLGRVLLADDNRDMREYVQRLLSPLFEVEVASDGQAALEAARARPPDLVLADVMMPRLGGMDLLRRLREEPSTRAIPILLLSARAGPEAALGGLEAGADDYLVKPFSSRELLARVRAHLELSRMRREIARGEALAASLREAVLARDDFLSIASHELKTPLTTLGLQLELLTRGLGEAASVVVRPHIEGLRRSVQRLGGLVGTLLDVSQLNTGRLTLHFEEVDLRALVVESISGLQDTASRLGSPLRFESDAIVLGRADRLRISQVVDNLLTNAVKFGQGRPVEVRLQTVGEVARLTVQDHGMGVAPQDRERIFQRFERAVSSRHYSGLGLGLWIVHQVVEAHGGTSRVGATPGGGATFTVELPLKGHEPSSSA